MRGRTPGCVARPETSWQVAVHLGAQTRSAWADRHRMLRGHFGDNPP